MNSLVLRFKRCLNKLFDVLMSSLVIRSAVWCLDEQFGNDEGFHLFLKLALNSVHYFDATIKVRIPSHFLLKASFNVK